MNMLLHLVTDRKVTFTSTYLVHEIEEHPYFYTMPKQSWLNMGRPSAIDVRVNQVVEIKDDLTRDVVEEIEALSLADDPNYIKKD